MTVQEKRAATTPPSPARDDTRPLITDDLDFEAARATPAGNDVRRVALACAARDERRVDGVRRDEAGRELDDLVHGTIVA